LNTLRANVQCLQAGFEKNWVDTKKLSLFPFKHNHNQSRWGFLQCLGQTNLQINRNRDVSKNIEDTFRSSWMKPSRFNSKCSQSLHLSPSIHL